MGKKNATSFKKGPDWKGNAKGRPEVPPDIKAARQLNQIEFERMVNHCMFELTVKETRALSKRTDISPALAMTARLVEKTAKSGNAWDYDFLLNRMIGRVREAEPRDVTVLHPMLEPAKKKTFSEFCAAAGYPIPYEKQIEMYDFGFSQTVPRLVLGARGYGKTDYLTILGVAYSIYLDPSLTFLIISKSKTRNTAMIEEIAKALIANGVALEKENASCVRVKGLQGKDHSAEVLTIKSSFRGRHPYMIIMDDPVTEEDTSEAMRKLVDKKYDEAYKLCPNILIVGQPVHAHDLYARLRKLLAKLEMVHGMIPELSANLENMRAAGIDEKSIQASYFLKIVSDGQAPFEAINIIPKYPVGDSLAYLDPSHKGGDTSALTIARKHFDGLAVVGFAAHRAWNHWIDDIVPKMIQFGVKRLIIECNGLGDQPVILLRQAFKAAGISIGVTGIDTTDNKHARIMSAGNFAHMIHLSQESDAAYTQQVQQYEYGAKLDDAPDSLASLMKALNLIRGK